MRIVAVNLFKRFAVRDDGRTVPILALYDAAGEVTTDAARAVMFEAGNAHQRFIERVDGFERVTYH